MSKLIIHVDGAAAYNPGEAGIGVSIADEQGRSVTEISQSIGISTNNRAEYQALITALEEVIRLGGDRVEVKSDSELMVRQINGQYRVKNAGLKPMYLEVKRLQGRLNDFTIVHIPREENQRADHLAKMALRRPL